MSIKPLKILLLLLILNNIAAGTLFGKVIVRSEEKITKPQPLAVGTRFFTKSTPNAGYQMYYTYMGFGPVENTIKVKYERYYHYDELEETDIFIIPVDPDKAQALLHTKPLFGETEHVSTKLLITITDGYGRIQVREYK